MTDKETLILAAKAAGYEVFERGGAVFRRIPSEKFWPWNPFNNDGDCFQLETALSIDVEWFDDGILSSLPNGNGFSEAFEDHNGDKDKARRYASTRAAALIGRE